MDAYMKNGIKVYGIARIFNADTGECVHEEISFVGGDGVTTSKIRKEMDDILSDYMANHDGEYYAILERRFMKAKDAQ